MWQAVKNVVPNYTVVQITQAEPRREASELIEGELVRLINERLRNKDEALEDAIIVTQVNLSNIDYSEVYEEAIEAKQLAEQQVLREERELARIRIEAQQRVAQAEAERDANIRLAEGEREARRIRAAGEADATRIQALAEAEAYLRIRQVGVDPMTNRFYEGWNGEFPRVVAGGGEDGLGIIFPASVAEGELSPEAIGILIQNFQREREALEQRISDEGTVIPDQNNDSSTEEPTVPTEDSSEPVEDDSTTTENTENE
jgi:regulator of protease activity HflC (stomatin/prohibitin superfamily)